MKGLDAIEKKVGQSSGHPVDANKMRGTNEKIVRPLHHHNTLLPQARLTQTQTDKARGMLEKATGKHVPDKVSN